MLHRLARPVLATLALASLLAGCNDDPSGPQGPFAFEGTLDGQPFAAFALAVVNSSPSGTAITVNGSQELSVITEPSLYVAATTYTGPGTYTIRAGEAGVSFNTSTQTEAIYVSASTPTGTLVVTSDRGGVMTGTATFTVYRVQPAQGATSSYPTSMTFTGQFRARREAGGS